VSVQTVVVGFDGSPGAEAALRFAAEEATLRGLALRIVCAWEAPPATYVGEAFAPTPDGFVEAERRAEEVLRSAVALAASLGVEAEGVAIEGHPATKLIEQARDAALLVVGSRGHGTAASLLLGSVSRRLAHHAPCPLVIVPKFR
jgi:nucleotide-binding universal stress UspA family protein